MVLGPTLLVSGVGVHLVLGQDPCYHLVLVVSLGEVTPLFPQPGSSEPWEGPNDRGGPERIRGPRAPLNLKTNNHTQPRGNSDRTVESHSRFQDVINDRVFSITGRAFMLMRECPGEHLCS